MRHHIRVAAFGKRRFSFAIGLLLLGLMMGCAHRQKGPSQHSLVMESLNLYEKGLYRESIQDWAGAEALYEQSLDISPRPIVYYHLGVVKAQQGKFEQALADLDNALEMSPSYTSAERERTRVTAIQQVGGKMPSPPPVARKPKKEPPAVQPAPVFEPEEVKPVVEEEPAPVAVQEPTGDISEFNQAMLSAFQMAEQGDHAGAIAEYKKAKQLQPSNARVYYNLGCLYHQQDQLKEAYKEYEKAIELKSDYGMAWNNMGAILERLSSSDEAMHCYEQAIAADNAPEAYFNSGLLLEKKGKLETALNRFRLFLEKGGQGDLAQEARQHIARLERRF